MKALFSDFDGTFYDDNYIENIKFVENLGIDFIIATGRHYFSLKNDLKVDCKYYICNDGAYILDSNKNCIYKNSINNYVILLFYALQRFHHIYLFQLIMHQPVNHHRKQYRQSACIQVTERMNHSAKHSCTDFHRHNDKPMQEFTKHSTYQYTDKRKNYIFPEYIGADFSIIEA